MNRVTKKDTDGHYYMTGDGIFSVGSVPEKFMGDDVDTVGAIEDILQGMDLGRLRELMEADLDKRVIVLPFRPPKTMYFCSKRFPNPQKAHYAAEINILWDMGNGCVFGETPEKAEAALKGEQDG